MSIRNLRQRLLGCVVLSLAAQSGQAQTSAEIVGRQVGVATRAHAVIDSATVIVYYIARPVGRETYRLESDGEDLVLNADFRYVDRGTAIELSATLRLDSAFAPTRFRAQGRTYRFVNVDVDVEVDGTTLRVRENGAESHFDLPANFFPTRGNAPVSARALLVRYWERQGRPDRLGAIPGRSNSDVRVEFRGVDTVRVGDRDVPLSRYSVDGVVWGREAVWLDADERFAAIVSRMHLLPLEGVRQDLAAALPQLQAAAVRDRMEHLAQLATDVRPVSQGAFALVGARLIDGTGSPTLEDATVVVRGGRIVATGPRVDTQLPGGTQVIDASGMTIVPGLWDMHAHASQIEWAPVYLAAGVTTVRDMGGEALFLTAMRDAIEERRGIGPRLLLAGLVDGDDDRAFGAVTAATPQEGRALVERYHAAGFVQMKLYSLLEADVARAITARAHELGMTVTGHIPRSLGLEAAVIAGMDHVAHLPIPRSAGAEEVHRLARFLAQHGTVVDPVMAWGELLGRSETTAIESFEPGITSVAGALAGSYRSGRNRADPSTVRARLDAGLAIVKVLHDAGVPIVAGTDGAVPGHSLLREIELYVQAGLTPMEAIQSATVVAARAMGLEDEVGTVAVGKRADLLVLDGNPLADIRNIRTGRWVVAAGRMYETDVLWRSAGFRSPR